MTKSVKIIKNSRNAKVSLFLSDWVLDAIPKPQLPMIFEVYAVGMVFQQIQLKPPVYQVDALSTVKQRRKGLISNE